MNKSKTLGILNLKIKELQTKIKTNSTETPKTNG